MLSWERHVTVNLRSEQSFVHALEVTLDVACFISRLHY